MGYVGRPELRLSKDWTAGAKGWQRQVFTGEHERMLDEKGRLVLPPTYRPHLADRCFLSRNESEPCLLLFGPDEVERVAARLKEKVLDGKVRANVQRRWSSSINEVKPDAQGRIAIPPKLRTAIGLDREVVVIGVIDRAEIWRPEDWAEVDTSSDPDIDPGTWI